MSDEVISKDQAEKIARNYVCGNCWHPLYVVNYDWKTKTAEVTCTNENCDHTSGFVSKYYVEMARANNRMQAQDFNRICGETIGIPRVKFTDAELKETINELWNY